MINFNKDEIKDYLSLEDIYDLLLEFNGEPEYYGDSTIISKTICHHSTSELSDASHKLYYYHNSKTFMCYTHDGGGWDVFELVKKVMKLKGKDFDLNQAIRWTAARFGFSGSYTDDNHGLSDKDLLNKYEAVHNKFEVEQIKLKEYDKTILSRFNYKAKIRPWLNENINQEVLNLARIGFYPGGNQITIPHYDEQGRLVGIRGRALCREEAEKYGKYRPLKIHGQLYNHPLGLNLYTLPGTFDNIKIVKKAIIVESEKSVLKYASMFGAENNICVAICGSSLSAHQVKLLMDAGATELIIGLDKQWQKTGDEEFKVWTKKLTKINEKYSNEILISFLFDKWNLLGYKDSPLDKDKKTFLFLLKNKVII